MDARARDDPTWFPCGTSAGVFLAASAQNPVGECLATQVLHHQIIDAVPLATSYTGQICGWLRREMARASRSKRSHSCGLLERCFGKNLKGNDAVKPCISGAIHLPMPPDPIGEMISYGPSRVEGERGMAVPRSLPHQSA